MKQRAPDEASIVAFLSDPATHGNPQGGVEHIETHGSRVFLAGNTAYKMKKPVNFSYMDFSTLALRKADTERELLFNKRTAPQIYRRVRAVVRNASGALVIGSADEGEPVEWLLEMARFDTEGVLDRVADRRELDPALMDMLARTIADFHGDAERRPDRGGHDLFVQNLQSNEIEFRTFSGVLFDPAHIETLARQSEALAYSNKELLDHRRDSGFVRHCHGDLHLGNIVLIEGTPVLFDCIEFSEDIACIDTLYGLAFLLMDLDYRGLKPHANRVLNGYLESTSYSDVPGNIKGLALLPLFLSCRAAVRAHVAARLWDAQDRPDALREKALSYFAAAQAFLKPEGPQLIAVGGLSGSGKTTLAKALAPEIGATPGALVLRTDVLRKRLAGVDPLEHLPVSAYTPEMSAKVYAELHRLARTGLAAGRTVILDGVYARPEERKGAEEISESLDVSFNGLWLEATPRDMGQRLDKRRGDASDANRTIMETQLGYDLGQMDWTTIDARDRLERTLALARAAIAPS